jgi:hypothetical protein
MSAEYKQWKDAWVARCNLGAGACWSRSKLSKAAALKGLKRQLKEDWSGLYDIDKMLEEGFEVGLFRDGGTSSYNDDEFVQTTILF